MNNEQKKTRALASLAGKKPVKVLFVCLGNICRSPAAEGVMLDIIDRHGDAADWVIDSAGTGGWHVGNLPDQRMRAHARRRGMELVHHCRQVKTSDFDEFDLIIPMDGQNEIDLRELAPSPEAQDKIVPMSAFVDKAMRADYIPDPYYEGAEGFELVLDLLQDGCNNLYNEVKALKS